MLPLLAAASMTSGCEWLMGGIPNEPDELEDASGLPTGDAGSAGDTGDAAEAAPRTDANAGPGGPGPDSGTKAEPKDAGTSEPADDRDATPGGNRDSGAPIDRDSGVQQPPPDAGVDAAVGGEPPDSGAPNEPCVTPRDWYPDKDGDGYGDRTATPVHGCLPSSGGPWADEGGDCHDNRADVNPGQTGFLDTPYRSPSGADSYDYDCSGVEEGSDGQRVTQPEACALLNLEGCDKGSGYLPTPRSGEGVNPWCGSTTEQTCAGLLGSLACGTDGPETVSDPYGCR